MMAGADKQESPFGGYRSPRGALAPRGYYHERQRLRVRKQGEALALAPAKERSDTTSDSD